MGTISPLEVSRDKYLTSSLDEAMEIIQKRPLEVFFKKKGVLRPATLLKRDYYTSIFLFAKFLKTPILKNICERLLLTIPN